MQNFVIVVASVVVFALLIRGALLGQMGYCEKHGWRPREFWASAMFEIPVFILGVACVVVLARLGVAP